MKSKLITLLLLIFPYIFIFSQSNEEMDRFLGQEQADQATATWLIYLSSETINQDASLDDAITTLSNKSYAGKITEISADSPIKYKDFAFIIMNEYNIPGGVFYSIFKSPRYAARELTYKRWMPGSPKPNSILTPWEVTSAISNILTWLEAQQ